MTRRIDRRVVLLAIMAVPVQCWVTPSLQRQSPPRHSTTALFLRGVQEDAPEYPLPRQIDEALLGDLTGGRPGAIIETEEQLAAKAMILEEMQLGTRTYPADSLENFGELQEDEEAEYDIDDPDALDSGTLGTWTIQELKSKFDYEWNPHSGEPDPNVEAMNQPAVRYIEENELDDDGVEVGYNPIFGPSNPIDTRTILGTQDSYVTDERTRDDAMLTPQFDTTDVEVGFNEEISSFRKSLDIIETYIDPFLPGQVQVPRHVAKWHGYPERTHYAPQNYTNNRFTEGKPTDFDAMEPYQARQRAVEMARSKNAEWLPDGKSQEWHLAQREPYEAYETLVGTLREGYIDPDVLDVIQPALRIFGSCAILLSADDGVYRFAYHGLMKNKHGMRSWMELLIADCGAPVTGVVFETGFRRRDKPYDGGDAYDGPLFW